jgi:anaerobic selenocysteine-containing dehydrogenase
VDPPGDARSDLEIFLDYADRMQFRDRDGNPLIRWHDAESAFAAWTECSRGRPCDYSALTYDRLRGGSGIQWPCTDAAPDGTERLYADGRFNTDPDTAETFGHDPSTGAERGEEHYRAMEPRGRAFLVASHYETPPETPTEELPLILTTGRTVFQFHTRTKTGRAPQLQAAAPDVWVEVNRDDATSLGVQEGDLTRVETAHGEMEAPARITEIRRGVIFVPFHYGTWDRAGHDRDAPSGRAANELTATTWDPVSKQPMFKVGAARVVRVAAGSEPAPAPTIGGSRPSDRSTVSATRGGPTAEASSRVRIEAGT